jgi:cold shock CspA family protein
MSIWDRMKLITEGKVEAEEQKGIELQKAVVGDTVTGFINNIVKDNPLKKKKGGYGFITSEQLPFERIFFHWTGLKQDTLRFPELKKRMKVEFQLQHNEFDGYRAIKIKVLK